MGNAVITMFLQHLRILSVCVEDLLKISPATREGTVNLA